MSNAFFIYNPNTQKPNARDDKVIPDPVVLGDTVVLIDGKYITVTATNGQLAYPLSIRPGTYPRDARERQSRRGAVRK